MQRTTITTALAAVALCGSAMGQDTLSLGYQGRVIEVVDDLNLFAGITPSLEVGGGVELDLGAENQFDESPDVGIDLGLFDAIAFDAAVGGELFTGSGIVAVVLNDATFNAAEGEFSDTFFVQGSLGSDIGIEGRLTGTFVGGQDLFSDSGIGGTETLDFDELDRAEITIEFATIDGDFDPNNPDGPDVLLSRVTVEVLNLSANGGRIATLGCVADVNEDDEVDFGDFFAWVTAFNTGDYRADINLDGTISDSDFFAWVTELTSGTCTTR